MRKARLILRVAFALVALAALAVGASFWWISRTGSSPAPITHWVGQQIQTIANQIAAALRDVRGAVDVFPDQIVGRSYLQIDIDREKAARYGVSVSDIQEAIEVAMGGKTIMNTVEGRQRFPVRVRDYARDFLPPDF